MSAEYVQMMENLMVVLGVIFLVFYMIKKMRSGKIKPHQHIKIIQAVPIGNKERILLISVRNKTLLVGATPNHIETLHTFHEAEEVTEELPVIKVQSFTETMSGVS